MAVGIGNVNCRVRVAGREIRRGDPVASPGIEDETSLLWDEWCVVGRRGKGLGGHVIIFFVVCVVRLKAANLFTIKARDAIDEGKRGIAVGTFQGIGVRVERAPAVPAGEVRVGVGHGV
jgi:hypothetical protein